MRKPKSKFKIRGLLLVVSVLALLIVPMGFSNTLEISASGTAQPTSSTYTDLGTSALLATDRITLLELNSLSNGNLSVASLESVIIKDLASNDVRQVLLDIGWENYSAGQIPYESWVGNWLTACDYMGIQNVIYLGQFTQSGIGSPWIESVIKADPSTQTAYSNGSLADYVSIDNPDVAKFVENDLLTLYSYYGSHQSWVGIGTGYPESDPYYSTNSTMSTFGYSNSSIANFANSAYFQQDVNSQGLDPNGVLDQIWAEFKNTTNQIVMSSGNWMTSSPFEVYGNGSNGNVVTMQFYLPYQERSIQLQWYGAEVGSPADLQLNIYSDTSAPPELNNASASETESAESVSSIAGWESPSVISGNFTSGNYWLVLSSPSSNSSNYYNVYLRDYVLANSSAYYSSLEALPKSSPEGSSVLWIKSQNGSSVSVYPYQQNVNVPASTQTFVATSAMTFNTVFLFLSDRAYNPVNATLEVIDETQGNEILAEGTLSQALTDGLQNWTPISLNDTVTTVPGHEYLMEVVGPNFAITWTTVMRGVSTDPSQSGFQNQSQYWIFELGYMNWSQERVTYDAITTNGADSVTSGYMDAVMFTPTHDETMESFSILMRNSNENSTYYNSGSLAFSIWSAANSSSSPSQPVLESVTVPGNKIPQNGWVNATGFSQSVQAGQSYWMVISTNSPELFVLARLTSAYSSWVLVSSDGGATWTIPKEGPTEFCYSIDFSQETLGNFVEGIPTVTLGTSTEFAQPFTAQSSMQVDGIFFGTVTGNTRDAANSELSVSIDLDNGSGGPSSNVVASGHLLAENITFDVGLQFVQFSSTAQLAAGQKYWIVVHPINGSFSVLPVVYTVRPSGTPGNQNAMITENDGFTWNLYSNFTTVLSYMLSSPIHSAPEYNTSTLFSDLLQYHNFPLTNSSTQKGWNAFVETSELNDFQQIASWLSVYAQRNFSFYASIPPELTESNFLSIQDLPSTNSATNCSSLTQYFAQTAPFQSTQYFIAGSTELLSECSSQGSGAFVKEMGYMSDAENYYGSGTTQNVLIVGDSSSSILTNYLQSTYNATYVQLALNPTLPMVNNASSFRTIIWISTANSLLSETISGIQDFVKSGGNILFLGQTPAWANAMASSGLNSPGVSGNTSQGAMRSIYGTLLNHTEYENDFSVQNTSINQTEVSEPSLLLSIDYYGRGDIFALGSTTQPIDLSQQGAVTAIVSNIIAYTYGLTDGSPLWFGNSGQGELLTLRGTPGGSVLAWLSNPTSAIINATINLSASYFEIPNSWMTYDVSNYSTYEGNGSVVSINVVLQPDSWAPVYVAPNSGQLTVGYSSVELQRQLVYPDQTLLTMAGTTNQSAIVVLSSPSPIQNVTLDQNQNISEFQSLQQFASTTQQGWLSYNGTLLVKYYSNGIDTMRVMIQTPSVEHRNTTTVIIYLVVSAALIETGIFAYFQVFNRKRSDARSQI